jgi:hypothetical protein
MKFLQIISSLLINKSEKRIKTGIYVPVLIVKKWYSSCVNKKILHIATRSDRLEKQVGSEVGGKEGWEG